MIFLGLMTNSSNRSDVEKTTGYFAKSNSSAYEGTVEFDLTESKQWQGFFDRILAIFLCLLINFFALLAVDRVCQ